jgi:hypothetical protein
MYNVIMVEDYAMHIFATCVRNDVAKKAFCTVAFMLCNCTTVMCKIKKGKSYQGNTISPIGTCLKTPVS